VKALIPRLLRSQPSPLPNPARGRSRVTVEQVQDSDALSKKPFEDRSSTATDFCEPEDETSVVHRDRLQELGVVDFEGCREVQRSGRAWGRGIRQPGNRRRMTRGAGSSCAADESFFISRPSSAKTAPDSAPCMSAMPNSHGNLQVRQLDCAAGHVLLFKEVHQSRDVETACVSSSGGLTPAVLLMPGVVQRASIASWHHNRMRKDAEWLGSPS
jgi:hypothetical protein